MKSAPFRTHDRHGRLIGGTIADVELSVLCSLDDLDKIARFAFANRNGQGITQPDIRARSVAATRPILREVLSHAKAARTAILRGDCKTHDDERVLAVAELHRANAAFLLPLALRKRAVNEINRLNAGQPRRLIDTDEGPQRMEDIVRRIALADDDAAAVWSRLLGELDRLGLSPHEHTDTRQKPVIRYMDAKSERQFTMGALHNMLTKIRR